MVALRPLPYLHIKGMHVPLPLVQGGMGIGVSLHPLASAVAAAGGLGRSPAPAWTGSSSRRIGRKVGTYEAVRIEVAAAKARGGFAGINIMVALQRDFEASVRGAIDAGADAIVSGAGLPLHCRASSRRRAPRSSPSSRPLARST